MQAQIYDRIFLGRRVPLARLKPEILTGTHHAGYLCTQMRQRRERLHTMWKGTGKKRPPAGIQNEKQETARSLPDAERN